MRGQVLVDGKRFDEAVADFDEALQLLPAADLPGQARNLAGRALALEGLSRWQDALRDYTQALEVASAAGLSEDAYIYNSRGNVHNSLGMYKEARADYQISANVFQRAKGFRGRDGSTTQRLDGAVFAASNAALMLVQLGDPTAALGEMTRIARRAPGSADMRAAIAALNYDMGNMQEAEASWEYACDRITVGCSKYTDVDWLRRVRRWPPAMVDKMQAFVKLTGAGRPAAGAV